MSVCSRAALIGAAIACCLVASACGGGDVEDTSTGSTTVTVYSSLPLQGPARATSESIVNAARLALEEVGGRVGKFTVKVNNLDDASAAAEGWDPDKTSGNARTAAQDKSTIAYLGELDWEASAISIPILNEVGILQISPASTYTGLTSTSDKGEPEKYYPGGKRSFGRVLPSDTVQAAAQVAYQRDEGCGSVFVIATRRVDAAALARAIVTRAPRNGIEVSGTGETDPDAAEFTDLATEVAASGADCAYLSWTGSDTDLRALEAIADAAPTMKLFVPSVPMVSTVVEGLRGSVAHNLRITSPALDREHYPAAGQRFFRSYEKKFGKEPDPYAIYGYEAMKATLTAIESAGDKGNDRGAVIDAFFKIRRRDSVLGRYSIDKNGDTSLEDYGAWRVANGELVFDQVIRTGS